jgi:RNA-directed DNA polymerase
MPEVFVDEASRYAWLAADTINHDWLIRFVEHRVGDKRVVRLIRNWLKAGVLDDGVRVEMEEATPQGL